MFKKLKSKFIFMNMVLLTTVFVGIFGTIYVSTAYSLNNDMKMQLWNNIMSPQQQQKPSPKDNKMDMSIKIDLDTKNEIVNVTSRLNTDDLDIHAMVEKVVNNSKKMDSIKIDGIRIWQMFTGGSCKDSRYERADIQEVRKYAFFRYSISRHTV